MACRASSKALLSHNLEYLVLEPLGCKRLQGFMLTEVERHLHRLLLVDMDREGYLDQLLMLIILILLTTGESDKVQAFLQTLPEAEAASPSLNIILRQRRRIRFDNCILLFSLCHLFLLLLSLLLLFSLVVELAFVHLAPLLVDLLLLPAELEPLWFCANPSF